jgi:mRNA-binding protein PUF3
MFAKSQFPQQHQPRQQSYQNAYNTSPERSSHYRNESWQSQNSIILGERRQRNAHHSQMYMSQQSQHMFMNQPRYPYPPYAQQYSPYQNLPMNGLPVNVPPQTPQTYPIVMNRNRDDEVVLQSALLREYRSTHNKRERKWELKDIYGHIVEFAGDQIGSRFLQLKLSQANSDEKALVFEELRPNVIQLMSDVFGNYVIQKFFEHGDQNQKRWLGDKMRNHIPTLSLQMYACRVVQKAFEYVLDDQQRILVAELNKPGLVIKLLECQHGNHVLQKAIEVIPLTYVKFIYDALFGNIGRFAEHMYGCRVVQRMLEQSDEDIRRRVLAELQGCGAKLIPDTFGNYVAQHVICHGDEANKNWMIGLVMGDMDTYGRHKFASNVVEKCIECGTLEQKREIMRLVKTVKPGADAESSGLLGYLKDQYGNYVVRKFIFSSTCVYF